MTAATLDRFKVTCRAPGCSWRTTVKGTSNDAAIVFNAHWIASHSESSLVRRDTGERP